MDEDEYEYVDSAPTGNPPDEEKKSIVEELYNTDKRITKLIDSWAGDEKKDAIAGRRFINKQKSALVGVINTTNAFTKITEEQARKILHRAVNAFIRDVANERTIKREHKETMIITYWHALQLFLGLAIYGHGANVLRDVAAGLNTPEQKEVKPLSPIEWAKSKI